MAHPYWPLFDLEVRTPRLTLRYVDDGLGCELVRLALRGVHDPGYMPFSVPWTDVPSPEFEREALRFYWRSRATTAADSWNILFAVLLDGEVIGSSNLGAESFPARRWFETGSWLGRDFQGQGIGTEMRVATLQFGFVALDALVAGTGAFADNGPSLSVTRKLGYVANGIEHHERRGELAEIHKYRMSRDHFMSEIRRDDVEIVGDEAAREILGVSR
jgi:RimJ/RimL family protein N-acetyltransferase